MHIKPSGIAMISGAALLFFLGGWIVLRSFSSDGTSLDLGDPNRIVLPDYLAQKGTERFPVYTDRLTSAWSQKTKVVANYGPEVLPLEDGAIAEVRCNGENGSPRYSVDSLGRVFKNGNQVYDTSKWPVCYFLEVHAGTPESIGKPYVVSMVLMK